MPRKSLIVAFFAVALAVPVPAGAATVHGVVVAKSPLRKAVVVAGAGGSAQTVATSRWRSMRLGTRLAADVRARADGTLAARSLRVTGRVAKARVRAVVLRYDASRQRYIVSAGGTAFALRTATRRITAVQQTVAPGTQIVATVDVSGGLAQAQQLTPVGQVGRLRFEGIITELSGSTLKIVVPQVGFVTVAVPAGFDVSKLKVFDHVRVEVAVGANGALTLTSIKSRRVDLGQPGRGRDDDDDDDTDDTDDTDETEDTEDEDDTDDTDD